MAIETAMVGILGPRRNVNAGGRWVNNNGHEKKAKTNNNNNKNNNKLYKERWAPKDHHHSGTGTGNRRHSPANRSPPSPPTRVDSWYVCDVEEKLRVAKEEIRVLMDKIQLQNRESMEAMDFQEQFFKDQIKSILEGKIVDDDDDGKEEVEEEENEGNAGPKSSPVNM